MLLRVMRALALSTFTLAALALVVDARAERGLPDGFPFLVELRGVGDVLERLGGSAAAEGPDAVGLPRTPAGVLGTASALPREVMPSAGPAVVPEETGPGLGTRPAGVRVNSGQP